MSGRLRIGACLSLSGKFAQFGRQAAEGLETWRSLDDAAEILIEDDRSDRRTLEAVLPGVAARCDILLGPYSTQLTRAAGRMAAESGWLVWNHGGSGDDVEGAHPGHVVSVLTPTSRYAEPFLLWLAGEPGERRDLCIVHGPGSFGRQVTDGAEAIAQRLGIRAVRVTADDQIPPPGISAAWDLFGAGVFEQDADLVSKASARQLRRTGCAPSRRAYGNSAMSSRILTASSASPSGSRAPGTTSYSGPLRMNSSAPTLVARLRYPIIPRSRPSRVR